MRDYSVDLYVTKSEALAPDSCEELAFIVRAPAIDQAITLALEKKEEAQAWSRSRVIEANVQEVDHCALSDLKIAHVVSGPSVRAMTLSEKKGLLSWLKS